MATARTKRFDTGVPDGRYFVVVQYPVAAFAVLLRQRAHGPHIGVLNGDAHRLRRRLRRARPRGGGDPRTFLISSVRRPSLRPRGEYPSAQELQISDPSGQ